MSAQSHLNEKPVVPEAAQDVTKEITDTIYIDAPPIESGARVLWEISEHG